MEQEFIYQMTRIPNLGNSKMNSAMFVCVLDSHTKCVCVCVIESERERREKQTKKLIGLTCLKKRRDNKAIVCG